MPPEPVKGAGRTARRGGGAGTALQLLGLGAALFGLLGLPLQTYGKYNDLTFWDMHTLEVLNHGHRTFFNSSAQLWFNWGLLIALGVVTVLLALTAALPRPAIAALTALVALVTIGWQALAMSRTGDFHKWQVSFKRTGSMWDHVGSGVWIGLGGLVVVLLGAVLTTLTSRRRV